MSKEEEKVKLRLAEAEALLQSEALGVDDRVNFEVIATTGKVGTIH